MGQVRGGRLGYQALNKVVSHISGTPVVISQKLVDILVPADPSKVKYLEFTCEPSNSLVPRVVKGKVGHSRSGNSFEADSADTSGMTSKPLVGLAFGYAVNQSDRFAAQWNGPSGVGLGVFSSNQYCFVFNIYIDTSKLGDLSLSHGRFDSQLKGDSYTLANSGYRYVFKIPQGSAYQRDLHVAYPSYSWRWVRGSVGKRDRGHNAPFPFDRLCEHMRQKIKFAVNGRWLDRFKSLLNKIINMLSLNLTNRHAKKARVSPRKRFNSYLFPLSPPFVNADLVEIALRRFKKRVFVCAVFFLQLLSSPALSVAFAVMRRAYSDAAHHHLNIPVSALQLSICSHNNPVRIGLRKYCVIIC